MQATTFLPRAASIPRQYHRTFLHLILDMTWYGVLSGSAIAFVAVFAARLGATPFQMSLLNAAPAIVNLLLTLPAGYWLKRYPLAQSVFVTSLAHRAFYLLWAVMPFWYAPERQIWILILTTLLMSIPGTALAIGFNAMFASLVPEAWRGYVVGWRQALFALVSIFMSLLCGWLLQRLPFPIGYQLVFGIGLLGAAMSSWHLYRLRHSDLVAGQGLEEMKRRDWASPGSVQPVAHLRTTVGLRWLTHDKHRSLLSFTALLRGRYGMVIFLLFFFHLSQYLAIPLFPLYFVNNMGLSDQEISLGNSLFYVALFAGSTQLDRLSQHWGHQRAFATGVITMALYPGLLALSSSGGVLYYLVSIVGGLSWSLAGGSLANYLLDRVPDDGNRPPYLAWYNFALYSGVLAGALLAPVVSQGIGIVAALMLAAILRFLSGYTLLRYG